MKTIKTNPKRNPSRSCIQRLFTELKLIKQEEVVNVKLIPDPDNMLEWYFLIHSLDKPYTGEYIGLISIPDRYPFQPPKIKMLTPSGRFNTDEDICTTFTNYHQETWSPSWNLRFIVMGFVSFMLDDDHGVGSILRTSKERQEIANQSFDYNLKHHSNILEYFTQFDEK